MKLIGCRKSVFQRVVKLLLLMLAREFVAIVLGRFALSILSFRFSPGAPDLPSIQDKIATRLQQENRYLSGSDAIEPQGSVNFEQRRLARRRARCPLAFTSKAVCYTCSYGCKGNYAQ